MLIELELKKGVLVGLKVEGAIIHINQVEYLLE